MYVCMYVHVCMCVYVMHVTMHSSHLSTVGALQVRVCSSSTTGLLYSTHAEQLERRNIASPGPEDNADDKVRHRTFARGIGWDAV
jgi:hypothetical protein